MRICTVRNSPCSFVIRPICTTNVFKIYYNYDNYLWFPTYWINLVHVWRLGRFDHRQCVRRQGNVVCVLAAESAISTRKQTSINQTGFVIVHCFDSCIFHFSPLYGQFIIYLFISLSSFYFILFVFGERLLILFLLSYYYCKSRDLLPKTF